MQVHKTITPLSPRQQKDILCAATAVVSIKIKVKDKGFLM